MCLQYKSFENTEGKGEIARTEQFLLFPQCFLPIWSTFCHSHKIWIRHLQTLSVWKGLKFIIWEWVNGKLYLLTKRQFFWLDRIQRINFVDKKSNAARNMVFVFHKAENIAGKGEYAGYQNFLLFPQCFQKASSYGLLKVGILCYRVNPFPNNKF